MSSVTARIKEIKQPRGGYIKPSQFSVEEIDDGNILNEFENIHASVVGMTVDYLTRYTMGTKLEEAFAISCCGAELSSHINKNAAKDAKKYLKHINGLDDDSIINACKMVTFDVWFRNPMAALLGSVSKVGKNANYASQTKAAAK